MLNNTLQTFAQSSAQCTVNGEPVDCGDAGKAIGGIFLIMLIFGLINLVFFLIAIIHLIKHSDVPDRTLWIILSIFIPFAAWVYVFGPRRNYNKKGGSAQTASTQNPVGSPSPNQWQNPAAPVATGVVAAPQASGSQEPPSVTPVTSSTASPTQVASVSDNPVQPPVNPVDEQPEPVQPLPSPDTQTDVSSSSPEPTPPPPNESESISPQPPDDSQNLPGSQV